MISAICLRASLPSGQGLSAKIHFTIIEVEDGGHGEELQSQEATFFQRLELGDTDGNGVIGSAANGE